MSKISTSRPGSPPQLTRRRAVLAGLGAWGAWAGPSAPARAADAPTPAPLAGTPHLAFATHALAQDGWWAQVQRGIQEASADFNVKVDYFPSASDDPAALAQTLRQLPPGTYHGLVHTIPDFGSVSAALEALRLRMPGLPTLTVNLGSTVHSELLEALAHVGQPDFATAELAGQRARKAGLKNFLCINHYSRIASSHARCKGFAVGAGLSVAETRQLSVEGSLAEMKQQIQRFIEQTPGIQGWLALGGPSAEAALEVVRALPKAQRPWLASFDVTPAIADGLRSGDIQFTIDQQPYLQGYLPVALLAQYLRGPQASWLTIQLGVFSNPKVHARMAHYGLELRPSDRRHLAAGPGFVTAANIERIERLTGRMR